MCRQTVSRLPSRTKGPWPRSRSPPKSTPPRLTSRRRNQSSDWHSAQCIDRPGHQIHLGRFCTTLIFFLLGLPLRQHFTSQSPHQQHVFDLWRSMTSLSWLLVPCRRPVSVCGRPINFALMPFIILYTPSPVFSTSQLYLNIICSSRTWTMAIISKAQKAYIYFMVACSRHIDGISSGMSFAGWSIHTGDLQASA